MSGDAPTNAQHAHCRRVRLSDLRQGEVGVIADAAIEAADREHLHALGLRPATRVRMCSCGDTCIVAAGDACSCRIGLARGLAQQIEVLVG